MKTVILPGYSPRNKQWAEETAESLDLDHEVVVHEWRHWNSDKSFSNKYEIEKIIEEVGDDEFNIISKSVGTRVALSLMDKYREKINKVVLTGFASTGENMKKLAKNALPDFPNEKLLIIQNTNDPYTSFKDAKDLLQSVVPDIEIVEKPGDKHHYPYPEEFNSFLKE